MRNAALDAGPASADGAGRALPTICAPVAPNDMPRAPAPPPADPVPPSYEQALAELERLVQAMEGGQMPLDRLLESYRRGAELLDHCRGRLQAVEEQVRVLEDGQLKPWIQP